MEAEAVSVKVQEVSFPTYPARPADLNPMFLERRVYQGSGGKVYPNPFTDQVSTQPVEKTYKAIILENEYVYLMMLPEIGGRIHIGFDKTNRYDFFYRQNVIKPALVGLLGPWISGGVEFNWPQHHRPSTFMPVHWAIERGADGSQTVWLSEHEPMNRMKGMVGICLYPGKSLVEAKVRLYNRTPFVQTFLWWANVAARVHDQYQAFFPPDVTMVADHAKRAVTTFPIARSAYYGVDYSEGVDISWYKNIPVPTSYMVVNSKYDFFGGYDFAKKAGFVHVADHRVVPGKKLWTWGNADFGYAWDRNLTDTDGPYIELMAGAYTDNQPDFSWLQPYETKTFTQMWYPLQQIGPVCRANRHAALSLQWRDGMLKVGICSSERYPGASITVTKNGNVLHCASADLAPGSPYIGEIPLAKEGDVEIAIAENSGCILLSYSDDPQRDNITIDLATEPPRPAEIQTVEELYLTGLHLQQYRHATRDPEPYWNEGLKRDSGNARINNAVGLLRLRNGDFQSAEHHFRTAVSRLTLRNPNPYDGEAYYNLGVALSYQERLQEAYDAFYKSIWNDAWKSPGFYSLGCINAIRGNYASALEHLDRSINVNQDHLKANVLKAAVLRKLGRADEANAWLQHNYRVDHLDPWSSAEVFFLKTSHAESDSMSFATRFASDRQVCIDVAFDYMATGFIDEAMAVLLLHLKHEKNAYPMIFYMLAALADKAGNKDEAEHYAKQAAVAPHSYCFPARLEEMLVLEEAIRRNADDAKAHYYLGNLYYDKRRYADAVAAWEKSVAIDPEFSIPWRNLGIAQFNVIGDPQRASRCYEEARAANAGDSRLLYEFDQLRKRIGEPVASRLELLHANMELVQQRDDLTAEYVTLLNENGRPEDALTILASRRFNPWEGGEGVVSTQYVWAHRILGRQRMRNDDFAEALKHFDQARHFPENLGEGKHLLALETDLDYFSGVCAEMLGHTDDARKWFTRAAVDVQQPSVFSYYRTQALAHLGREQEAQSELQKLLKHAGSQRDVEPKIDYFATSLPNLLLFNEDLAKTHRTECLLLTAFAMLGLHQTEDAMRAFREALELDPNSLFAQQELQGMSRLPSREAVR
jgi:tetratricopeptide (TPR) repeat protein